MPQPIEQPLAAPRATRADSSEKGSVPYAALAHVPYAALGKEEGYGVVGSCCDGSTGDGSIGESASEPGSWSSSGGRVNVERAEQNRQRGQRQRCAEGSKSRGYGPLANGRPNGTIPAPGLEEAIAVARLSRSPACFPGADCSPSARDTAGTDGETPASRAIQRSRVAATRPSFARGTRKRDNVYGAGTVAPSACLPAAALASTTPPPPSGLASPAEASGALIEALEDFEGEAATISPPRSLSPSPSTYMSPESSGTLAEIPEEEEGEEEEEEEHGALSV